MTTVSEPVPCQASDALLAAVLLTIASDRLGGVALTGCNVATQEAWLAAYSAMRPDGDSVVLVPASMPMNQIDGGIDLAATLGAGRQVIQPGLLERAAGRPLVLMGVERWSRNDAGILTAAVDRAARAGRRASVLLAIDGSSGDDAGMPPVFADRLAFRLDLGAVRPRELCLPPDLGRQVTDAQHAFAVGIELPAAIFRAMIAASASLGIVSSRADCFVATAACAHAAWRGVSVVGEDDAGVAVRLTLAHRARQRPAERNGDNAAPMEESGEHATSSRNDQGIDGQQDGGETAELQDRLVEIAAAALPPDALDGLKQRQASSGRQPQTGGRSRGAARRSKRGRPVGHTAGDLRRDGPLHLIATVERAAPWQTVRRRALATGQRQLAREDRRLIVMPADIRIVRYRQERASLKILAVDASGSSALNRMGEAKGAIELILAQCYARREQVALVVFRGTEAEVLLPPTRALARARRELSALPGGGATPLAGGIEAARALAAAGRRAGQAPLVVVLTDGRANIDREGRADRKRAHSDAIAAARRVAADGFAAVIVDTSTSGQRGAELAAAMRARHVPLPNAGAHEIAETVALGGR